MTLMEEVPVLAGRQLHVTDGGLPTTLMHPPMRLPESKNVYLPAVLIVNVIGVMVLEAAVATRGRDKLGGTTAHCAKSIVDPEAKL